MITDFLNTQRSKEELSTALSVVRLFKNCESGNEWLAGSFESWVKLEQLEEFLAHLVEGAPLAEDTVEFIKQVKSLNTTP